MLFQNKGGAQMPQTVKIDMNNAVIHQSVEVAAAQSKSDMETLLARMNDVKEGRSNLLTKEDVRARLNEAGY
jgi:hypothetical protein